MKNVKLTSQCRWKFCPAIGNYYVIFLRCLVPLFSGIIKTMCHILLQHCVIFYYNNVSYFITTICHILLQQCVIFY